MKTDRGYSLVELVMVVGLVSLLVLTVTVLLFTSLSGTGKAAGLAVVKQNGDYTIGVFERLLHDAKIVNCSFDGVNYKLVVTDKSGTTTFKVEDDTSLTPVVPRVAANSAAFPHNYLTSEKIFASNFWCKQTAGSQGIPDVISASFRLTFGKPGVDRPSEVASDTFETRVSLRTY